MDCSLMGGKGVSQRNCSSGFQLSEVLIGSGVNSPNSSRPQIHSVPFVIGGWGAHYNVFYLSEIRDNQPGIFSN